MGVKLPAVKAQIKHLQQDTGLDAPLDQQGAEYMVLLSSMEIMNFPEYLAAIARIMKQAGKTWTISSKAFEATNSGVQIGVSDIARELVGRVVDAAEGLGVKTVISPECGHAYTAIRWDGANPIGRPYKFEVKHILEVLDTSGGEESVALRALLYSVADDLFVPHFHLSLRQAIRARLPHLFERFRWLDRLPGKPFAGIDLIHYFSSVLFGVNLDVGQL